jgi:hypothetical protein
MLTEVSDQSLMRINPIMTVETCENLPVNQNLINSRDNALIDTKEMRSCLTPINEEPRSRAPEKQ